MKTDFPQRVARLLARRCINCYFQLEGYNVHGEGWHWATPNLGPFCNACWKELNTGFAVKDAPDTPLNKHRCSGCELRWEGKFSGVELCGDCWRALGRGAQALQQIARATQTPQQDPDMPALAYECEGQREGIWKRERHLMLLSYRGVHSCVPPCPAPYNNAVCGAPMRCIDEHPRCRCGAHYYIDGSGRPYCPRNPTHGIPYKWTIVPKDTR